MEGRGGERVSRTFNSLQAAREWRERREVNPTPELPAARYSVAELIRDFKLRRYPFLGEGTVILYERRLSLLKPLLRLEVDALNPKDIGSWIDWLKGPESLSGGRSTRISFEKELKTLGVLLRWYIEENDDSKLIFPIKRKHFERAKVKKPTSRQVVLSDLELETWFQVLRQDDPLFYAMAITQVFQALRVSEICAMKWSNLDAAGGRYQMREHVIWPRVGGRPPKLLPGTKSREDAYWIPLWEQVQENLAKCPQMRRIRSDLFRCR